MSSTGKWHGGKGSAQRPLTDSDAYSKNWARIFNDGKEWPDFPIPDNPVEPPPEKEVELNQKV